MKRVVLFLCLFHTLNLCAQGYNFNRTSFAKYLTRMYNSAPFEGVRIVNDYEESYLISVVQLDSKKYSSESTLNRVASVKAMSQASRFFNGSMISQDFIIYTSENPDKTFTTQTYEEIKENSVGFVKSLELLISIKKPDNLQVFIFITPLKTNNQQNEEMQILYQ